MPRYFNPKYTEWKGLEEMYEDSNRWLSELEFTVTEQHFLDDLFGKYFLKLIAPDHNEKGKELLDKLGHDKLAIQALIKEAKRHHNELQVLIDTKEPSEEKNVKSDHNIIQSHVQEYLHGFKELKADFFVVIGDILAFEKRKKLVT